MRRILLLKSNRVYDSGIFSAFMLMSLPKIQTMTGKRGWFSVTGRSGV